MAENGANIPKPGHNGGPELDDDDPTGRLLFVRWAWTEAHKQVWKTPPLDILRFRVARAEAAGLTYREYMLELLDSGRYPQAKSGSAKPARAAAKPTTNPHARSHGPVQAPVSAPALAASPAAPKPAKPWSGMKSHTRSAGAGDVPAALGATAVDRPAGPQSLRKVHK